MNIEVNQIKEEAARQGFSLFGITTPHSPSSFPIYEQWLANGYHANMAYLSAERAVQRRKEPNLMLSDCRSIVVLGIPYSPVGVLEPEPKGVGKIAAYATKLDYHEVLMPRLNAIVAYIEAQLGFEVGHRCYTDTGPILERDLAQRAGLGWVGKNSMLIHPKYGSSFFLAEILLDIELPANEQVIRDHCGNCQRCIEACPSSCILPNRTINANDCVSYLTIENKGEIAENLRAYLGNWVFGCDICQQVCPWNRFARDEVDEAFSSKEGGLKLSLNNLFALSSEAFKQSFSGSPMQRAKRKGLLRNAAVVLGNQAVKFQLSDLIKYFLEEDEALVRSHLCWAMAQKPKEESLPVLIDLLSSNLPDAARNEIQNLIEQIKRY